MRGPGLSDFWRAIIVVVGHTISQAVAHPGIMTRKYKHRKSRPDIGPPTDRLPPGRQTVPGTSTLRIIGGQFRGRPLVWTGDPITRPMKDNIREAVFNLVGGWIPGKHVLDLFAGSGAIGIEALSRGAVHATLIERHFPTVKLIRDNIKSLQIQSQCTVAASDTFFWSRQFLQHPGNQPVVPWAVFCSPPYDLFVSRKQDMLDLIRRLKQASPQDSLFIVESDDRFDPADLPDPDQWRVRQYAPAQISVIRPPGENRIVDD